MKTSLSIDARSTWFVGRLCRDHDMRAARVINGARPGCCVGLAGGRRDRRQSPRASACALRSRAACRCSRRASRTCSASSSARSRCTCTVCTTASSCMVLGASRFFRCVLELYAFVFATAAAANSARGGDSTGSRCRFFVGAQARCSDSSSGVSSSPRATSARPPSRRSARPSPPPPPPPPSPSPPLPPRRRSRRHSAAAGRCARRRRRAIVDAPPWAFVTILRGNPQLLGQVAYYYLVLSSRSPWSAAAGVPILATGGGVPRRQAGGAGRYH